MASKSYSFNGLEDAVKRLHDGKVSWIIVGPAEGPAEITGGLNFNLIEFKKEGDRGMQEFLAHISDTTVSWGAFKIVTGKPGCDGVIIKNPEFIVLKWTSNHKAPLTVSIKTSVQKVDFDVKQTLGVQNQFDALSLDDFNEEVIKLRYRRVYGDHEPVAYEFNNFSI